MPATSSADELMDVDAIINAQPLSSFQKRVIALCALIAMFDGFDIQAMALAAPIIAQEWNVSVASFAAVFSAAPIGMLLGALAIGAAADRFGRRRMILLSCLVFAICTILMGFARGITDLVALRFVAGVGMGGVIPNLLTLSSEYAPERLRGAVVTLTFCGVPIGALMVALVGTFALPVYGWRPLFILGGGLPLLILPLLAKGLPESIRFLAARPSAAAAVRAIFQRMYPGMSFRADARFAAPRLTTHRRSLSDVFEGRLRLVTPLLWLAFVSAFIVIHFLGNWLPSILSRSGLPTQTSLLAMVFLNLGAILGGLSIGHLIDRFGSARVLIASFAAAFGCTLLAGALIRETVPLMIAVFALGTLVLGGQIGMNTIATKIYPVAVRGTGVGLASGIGRLGAIIGPAAGGVLLANRWAADNIFIIVAAVVLTCLFALILLAAAQRGAMNAESASGEHRLSVPAK